MTNKRSIYILLIYNSTEDLRNWDNLIGIVRKKNNFLSYALLSSQKDMDTWKTGATITIKICSWHEDLHVFIYYFHLSIFEVEDNCLKMLLASSV